MDDARPGMEAPPLIGVIGDLRALDGMDHHIVGDKYLRAVAEAAGAMPVLLPALGLPLAPETLLAPFDGLLCTGSPSNVHPSRYGLEDTTRTEPHDEARDGLALALIPAAVALGLPLLCICRGFQELNVAMGGSLHPRIREVPGRMEHHSPPLGAEAERYAPFHPVAVAPGGAVAAMLGAEDLMVNSLHYQALDRVAPGLRVEAVAPDGTPEAVVVADAPGFALGVQWHPEFAATRDPASLRLFQAFGSAARAHARGRGRRCGGR